MKETKERPKCKYCHRDGSLFIKDFDSMLKINTQDRVISACGDGDIGEASLDINYCPVCGRKLGD